MFVRTETQSLTEISKCLSLFPTGSGKRSGEVHSLWVDSEISGGGEGGDGIPHITAEVIINTSCTAEISTAERN